MNNKTTLFGVLAKSRAGGEALLCAVHPQKGGQRVSLDFVLINPIQPLAHTAPPDHPGELSFLEEIRTMGRATLEHVEAGGWKAAEVIRTRLLQE